MILIHQSIIICTTATESCNRLVHLDFFSKKKKKCFIKLRPHTTDCWSGPDTFLIPVYQIPDLISESPNLLSLPQSPPFLTNKEVSWIWYKVWSDQYHAACGRSFTAPKKYYKTHWKLAHPKALKIIFRNDDHALKIKELREYLPLPTAAYLVRLRSLLFYCVSDVTALLVEFPSEAELYRLRKSSLYTALRNLWSCRLHHRAPRSLNTHTTFLTSNCHNNVIEQFAFDFFFAKMTFLQ